MMWFGYNPLTGGCMPRATPSSALSAGQAHYVLERMLAERRVSVADVQPYLDETQRATADTERRLQTLRSLTVAHDGDATPPAKSRLPTTRARRRKHSAEGRLGLRFSGLIRHLPQNTRAALIKVRLERGVEAAIAEAHAAAK